MTKPFPINTTYMTNSPHSCSDFTNERMGEPLGFGPMLRSWNCGLNVLLMPKNIFCSCGLQTVTTTGTPPGGDLVWTDTFTMSTVKEKSYEPPMACCSKTCAIYASSVQIKYWHVDLNIINSSITAAPASSPDSTVAGSSTLQVLA